MRFAHTIVGIVTFAYVGVMPAYAGQRGRAGAHGPAAHAPATSPATQAPKAHGHPHTTAAPTATSTKTTPHTTTTTSPIAQKIQTHPQLATRLTALLPTGMTLDTAAKGFRNQGQFIAALHVSHNLNIPFAQLKTEMTGSNHRSLGQAIQTLRPTTDSHAATERAEHETNDDLKLTTATKPHGHSAR